MEPMMTFQQWAVAMGHFPTEEACTDSGDVAGFSRPVGGTVKRGVPGGKDFPGKDKLPLKVFQMDQAGEPKGSGADKAKVKKLGN